MSHCDRLALIDQNFLKLKNLNDGVKNMETRNVAGIPNLKWAIAEKVSNMVVSLHQHPDGARRFLNTFPNSEDFEIVELLDSVGYRQR
jgi:hypothetical protein